VGRNTEIMADPFNPLHNSNWSINLHVQKYLLEKYFDWLTWDIRRKQLKGLGVLNTPDLMQSYTVEFSFSPPRLPKVFILDPLIPFSDDIHLYPNQTGPPYALCLCYNPDHMYPLWNDQQPDDPIYLWPNHLFLVNTIIPWTVEWIMCYENWWHFGKWEAPEVLHTPVLKSINRK